MTMITIATRESQLALWQANYVRIALERLYPDIQVKLLGITTRGDKILDQSLSKIGGKGLFVKELETALLDGRADIAVHSLKDVPMHLPEGLILAAICPREDPRDAFVSNHYKKISDLPVGAVIGTSSVRREAQIKWQWPHLNVKSLRGNVQTRLKRLEEKEYDGIILAVSGLTRLALTEKIAHKIPITDSMPAPGQGALGIEISANRKDLITLLSPLNDSLTAACVTAERSLSREMGGNCQTPLGAYAKVEQDQLRLQSILALPNGSILLRAEEIGHLHDADALGKHVAELLNEQGAQHLLAKINYRR